MPDLPKPVGQFSFGERTAADF